jgi:hypothetical protein
VAQPGSSSNHKKTPRSEEDKMPASIYGQELPWLVTYENDAAAAVRTWVPNELQEIEETDIEILFVEALIRNVTHG